MAQKQMDACERVFAEIKSCFTQIVDRHPPAVPPIARSNSMFTTIMGSLLWNDSATPAFLE
jgi:hypothetical protein